MATTTTYALRYPIATDRVADGATAMQQLAEDVEGVLKDSTRSLLVRQLTLNSTGGLNPASVVQLVKGSAAQTGYLTEWQNSSGATVARIGASGGLALNTAGIIVNGSSGISSAVASVWLTTAGAQGLIVRGTTGQTGNLTEWQNVAGTTLATVTPSGVISAADLSVSGYSISRGVVAVTSNAAQVDSTAATNTVVTVSPTLVAGRLYRASARMKASQLTSTGTAAYNVSSPTQSQLLYLESETAGHTAYGSGHIYFRPAASGAATFTITASTTGGTTRVAAADAQLCVEDVGI